MFVRSTGRALVGRHFRGCTHISGQLATYFRALYCFCNRAACSLLCVFSTVAEGGGGLGLGGAGTVACVDGSIVSPPSDSSAGPG